MYVRCRVRLFLKIFWRTWLRNFLNPERFLASSASTHRRRETLSPCCGTRKCRWSFFTHESVHYKNGSFQWVGWSDSLQIERFDLTMDSYDTELFSPFICRYHSPGFWSLLMSVVLDLEYCWGVHLREERGVLSFICEAALFWMGALLLHTLHTSNQIYERRVTDSQASQSHTACDGHNGELIFKLF